MGGSRLGCSSIRTSRIGDEPYSEGAPGRRIIRAAEAAAFLVPSGGGQVALAVLLVIVVAVSEEVIFRGYLIHRFKAVLKSPVAALMLSSAVFAMGHGYERSGGMVGVAILGLIFGAIYLWRKSLVAPMVVHFIQDFFGMILIPLGVLS